MEIPHLKYTCQTTVKSRNVLKYLQQFILYMTKEVFQTSRRKLDYSVVLGQMDSHTEKIIKLYPYYTPNTKIYFKSKF